MKKILLIALLLNVNLALKAQQLPIQKPDSNKYITVEVEPTFPGGIFEFYSFINKKRKNTGDSGKVFVSFTVERDGTLTGIKVERSLSEKADKEAIRLMGLSPKWNPGMAAGKPVRVRYSLPINFN